MVEGNAHLIYTIRRTATKQIVQVLICIRLLCTDTDIKSIPLSPDLIFVTNISLQLIVSLLSGVDGVNAVQAVNQEEFERLRCRRWETERHVKNQMIGRKEWRKPKHALEIYALVSNDTLQKRNYIVFYFSLLLHTRSISY